MFRFVRQILGPFSRPNFSRPCPQTSSPSKPILIPRAAAHRVVAARIGEKRRMDGFTQNQLAARWKHSPRTLEQWRWKGIGPRYLKIGGRVIYPLEEVEAYEAARLHQNTSGPILRED